MNCTCEAAAGRYATHLPICPAHPHYACNREFGFDHDHDDAECERMLDLMSGGYEDDYMADAYNREAEEAMLGRPLFPNEY